MTSATEHLRALLTERGVEWEDCGNGATYVEHNGEAWRFDYDEPFDQLGIVCLSGYTPEQAIDATLGRGTCRDVRSEDATIAFECSECGCWVAYDEYWETGIYIQGEGQQAHIHPRYCANCGRKVVE